MKKCIPDTTETQSYVANGPQTMLFKTHILCVRREIKRKGVGRVMEYLVILKRLLSMMMDHNHIFKKLAW